MDFGAAKQIKTLVYIKCEDLVAGKSNWKWFVTYFMVTYLTIFIVLQEAKTILCKQLHHCRAFIPVQEILSTQYFYSIFDLAAIQRLEEDK